jgi:DNA-binding NarL/FixJ family response regulator
MPGLDGMEALAEMRKADRPPAVIVHSGFASDIMRHRVMEQGAQMYLEKGGNLGEVRAAVRQVIDGSRRS